MDDCHAVLLDTVSIQNYIFQSNKLKENLGASWLVQDIYRHYLARALCEVTGRPFSDEKRHLETWMACNADRPDCTKPVDIGYIGGGNALLFFPDDGKAKQFIEAWTKLLLVQAPGLTTAVAHCSFDASQFRPSLDALLHQLEENKARHSPITSLPRHGITAECARSGISAEIYNKLIDEHVSAGVNAKIEAATESKQELEKRYSSLLGENYCFSNELDDLGGIEGEDSHIAVVHIDGNDIGERFKQAQNLKAICSLSTTVYGATEIALDAVVETARNRYKDIMDSLGFDPGSNNSGRQYPTEHKLDDDAFTRLENETDFPKKYLEKLRRSRLDGYGSASKFRNALEKKLDKTGKIQFTESESELLVKYAKKRRILPIRPIVLGGDDITFVCDGKLGIYFAKMFIERFEEAAEELTACAGVAIIKTKYPFYRGYWLAEELCANAKKKRRAESSTSSFLDFHVSLGGIAGSLKMIRQRDLENKPQGSLLYRPFEIVPKGQFDELGLDMFLEKAVFLRYLPQNKQNELREVLALTEDATSEFVQALQYRNWKLPEIEGYRYSETLFENDKTPYFDMLEILRFFPDFALKEMGGAHD